MGRGMRGGLAFAVIAMLIARAYSWWSAPEAAAESPRFGKIEATFERFSPEHGKYHLRRRVDSKFRHVTRTELGDRWPLTVDEAWVGCAPELSVFTVLLVVDGTPWALNGTTKSWAKGGGYSLEIDGRPRVVRVSDEPEWWWAVDGKTEMLGMITPRKSIGPLFDAAEELGCLDPPPNFRLAG